MPNVTAVLNEQIRRLARREITASTKAIKKAIGHYRREIASLKRQISGLIKLTAGLQKQIPQPSVSPVPIAPSGARFRADGLKAHRARLGLSAKEYGQLVGVSGLTIYNWENRKSKPRATQLASIFAVRKMGKRDASRRLGVTEAASDTTLSAAAPAENKRNRGKFARTGEESVMSWLKRKPLTTRELNEAWKSDGRSGSADVLLGRMVKAKTLKRTKLQGQRGSTYSLA